MAIKTPFPMQSGMVTNYGDVYFNQTGDTCATIAIKTGISLQQLLTWNPAIDADCSGLWVNANVRVPTMGHTQVPVATAATIRGTVNPKPAAPTATVTAPRCRPFHVVVPGVNSCTLTANQYSITTTQLKLWNSFINIGCTNLSYGNAVCVPNPGEVSFWTSMGCYNDSASARALMVRISIPYEVTVMTPKL